MLKIRLNSLVIIIASITTFSGSVSKETPTATSTKNKQLSNEGVSMYTNELYMGGGGGGRSGAGRSHRNRNKTSVNSKQNSNNPDEYPVYDDYNADYDNFPATPFRKQFLHHQQQQLIETREILIKQGRLKGMVRVMHPQSGLRNVDQFLGIPYAEAPIDRLRFMPPGAPVPWSGLKMATKFAPVCPQNLPDINSPSKTMSKGRYDQIKRLLPYLKNESEDCLYLNLYVPSLDGSQHHTKYPVIVYIHGESYEWNSGNPYDGSILASYGQVIVVTINYRLGVLGFLKPGINGHSVSNFGLFDQIAALQWIKENIESFGGDSKAVTLMGHGHGAACINFLMISPVAKGLFHRSILMAGSALSDWALANEVVQTTLKVAQDVNCPIVEDNDELLKCLRNKEIADLMAVNVPVSEFSTRFGPIIDGLVVPNAVHKVMGQFSDIFSRYDLMYGVTELESYHSLNAVSLTYGILANERDTVLKTYIQNRFDKRPDLALAATLKEYTDIYTMNTKALAEEHRDTLLEILSDARVTAPLVQTGLYLSNVNPNCFMFVFSHNSEAGEYGRISQSVVGEELPYIFGAPLGQVGPFQPHYNQQERLFSEAIMRYWTNFAKSGNPKMPWSESFLNMSPQDWHYYNVDWPPFNPTNQTYLHMGITPIVSHRYRYKYMKFWNQELPIEMEGQPLLPAKPPKFEFPVTKPAPRRTTSSSMDMITGRMNLYPKSRYEDPIDVLKHKLQTLPSQGVQSIQEPSGIVEPPVLPKHEMNPEASSTENILQSESTLTLLIGIVLLFLIFNVFVIIGYVVKRNMSKRKLSHKYQDNIFDAMTDVDKRSKYNETDDSYIMDMVRRNGNSNQYEAIKATRLSDGKAFILTRQLSSSTVDAHTKVTDWISQDMTNYSVESNLEKPEKVSIAIDATPTGRGGSVLRQEPIEVTKAKKDFAFGKDIIICQEVDMDPVLESAPIRFDGEYQRTTSITDEDPPIVFSHKHSSSDPVPIYYPDEGVTSFIEPSLDINVTSRDSIERKPLTPEESLQGIQRRNFPKVLPDYPLSMPETDDDLPVSLKRRSLPPQYFMMHAPLFSRYPPAPPPRISSTLERRRPSNTSTFLSSSVKIVDEPPSPPDPPIAVTALQVGPLIPKNHHSEPIYMSMRRMNSIQENSTPSTSVESVGYDESETENKEIPESGLRDQSIQESTSNLLLLRQMSSTSDESESSTGTVKQMTKQSNQTESN